MNIPFDVSYHFDANLHEVPNSRAGMQQAIAWLQMQLEQTTDQPERQLQILGLLGSYGRILHNFSLAKQALLTAIDLAESIGSDCYKVINLIRLAHVYQWQHDYVVAEALFDSALVYCRTQPELSSYRDFVYQHWGKCKFDQAYFAEAQAYCEQAMELRLKKGDQSLILSTQLVLEKVCQRLHTPAASSIGELERINQTREPQEKVTSDII